jgi:hypothetical protein
LDLAHLQRERNGALRSARDRYAQKVLDTADIVREAIFRESTLQRYLAAYVRRSFPDLLTVWPDLQNQKKDYDTIKRHLADPSVSREEMTIELREIQSTHDGALVRAHRTEQFVRTETTSVASIGDLRVGEPRRFPGPSQIEKKTDVKKSGEVWITMRPMDDLWIIVSVSEKKPR